MAPISTNSMCERPSVGWPLSVPPFVTGPRREDPVGRRFAVAGDHGSGLFLRSFLSWYRRGPHAARRGSAKTYTSTRIGQADLRDEVDPVPGPYS